MNGCGLVTLVGHQLPVGLPLAGRQQTLRIEEHLTAGAGDDTGLPPFRAAVAAALGAALGVRGVGVVSAARAMVAIASICGLAGRPATARAGAARQ